MTSADIVYSRKDIPLHHSTVRRVLNRYFAYLSYGRTTDLGVCMECEDYAARKAYWKSIGLGTPKESEWLQAVKIEYIEYASLAKQHKEEHESERVGFDERRQEVEREPKKKMLLTLDYTKSKRLLQSMSGTKVIIEYETWIKIVRTSFSI